MVYERRLDFTGMITSDTAVIIFFIVILSFMSVSLWLDFFNKVFYNYVGFDQNSPWPALLFASFVTLFIVSVVMILKYD